MKCGSICLVLAMVATFAIAGCGQDNNDNGGGTPSATPTRTSTPAVTVTPTTVTSTSTSVTPTTASSGPTVTPTPGNDCPAQMNLTLVTTSGADLDTGFSGIGFDQGSLIDTKVTTALDCTDNSCTINDASLVGTPFGSPLPLTAGGATTCVVNTFAEPITGTYDCTSGCSATRVRITSQVFSRANPEQPCPICSGDDAPNDGNKNGTCPLSDSTNPGGACDVNGTSDVGLGSTSNDCLPTGSDIGKLTITFDPFTTGTATLAPSLDCADPDAPPGACYCPGQVALNQCNVSGICEATSAPDVGECSDGPLVGRCSGKAFFLKCDHDSDCEPQIAGSGTCQFSLKACIPNGATITRTGQCGIQSGVGVATFCIPATTAPAINTVIGLPGPGAVSLPGTTTRTAR